MERDGISRTYHYRTGNEAGSQDGEPKVREAFPDPQEIWTVGDLAQDVINRTDLVAVHGSRAPYAHYMVNWVSGDVVIRDLLDVEVSGLDPYESHKKLVEAIEELTGKQGFTVRVG